MDEDLRRLERLLAAAPDAALRARHARALTRAGLDPIGQVAERFVADLTAEGALWVAWQGCLYEAEARVLEARLAGVGCGYDGTFASAIEAGRRVVAGCRARARREWDPIAALSVLSTRWRVKRALGLRSMPRGTAAEERRLREVYARELVARGYGDTDLMDRLSRPPPSPPAFWRASQG